MNRISACATALVVLLAVLCQVHPVHGHIGDVLSAFASVPPTMDGLSSQGEWDEASQVSVFGGDFAGSTFYVMNDASNLYLAIGVVDSTLSPDDRIEVRFDNTHDGTAQNEEDELGVGADYFSDGHFKNGRWGLGDLHQDGSSGAGSTGTTNFLEMSHPIDSGDPDDVSLSYGHTLGFCLRYFRDGTATIDGTYPYGCVLASNDQLHYGDIRIAGPPPCLETTVFATEFGSGELSVVDLTMRFDTTVAKGLNGPVDVVLNAAENTAYVTEFETQELKAVNVVTGTVTTLADRLGGPSGLALIKAETGVFVTDNHNGELLEVDFSTSPATITTVTTGLDGPAGVALNVAENIAFVAESSSGELSTISITEDRASIAIVTSALGKPTGVALSADETRAYVTDFEGGYLLAVDIDTGNVTTVASGLNYPSGLALSSDEATAYVTDSIGGKLLAIEIESGSISTVVTGLRNPGGVAISCLSPKVTPIVKVPLRWCGVQGSPSIENPGQVLEATTDDVLMRRHERVTNRIYLPQARASFISGTTARLPSFPILPDPDTSSGRPGDVFVVSRLNSPYAITVNAAGTTVFVSGFSSGRLWEVEISTGTYTAVATGLGRPEGMALSADDTTAYVADSIGGNILAVDIGSGTVTTVATGLGFLEGLALDDADNTLYVLTLPGHLLAVDIGSGTVTTVATRLDQPRGISIDVDKKIAYITEFIYGKLLVVDLSTGDVTTKTSGLYHPTGVALDIGEEKAYVSETALDELREIDLVTGRIVTLVTPSPFLDYTEFFQLINDCRDAWAATDPTVTGITVVHVRLFVDQVGDRASIIGLGGRVDPSNTASQTLWGGRAMVIDNAFTLPCSDQASPCMQEIGPDSLDTLLGHELGHALTLEHGNGLDDDGDNVIDEPDEGDTLNGPNLMQYSQGTEITTGQADRMRSQALLHIPDRQVDPEPEPLGKSRTDTIGDVPAGQQFIDIESFGVAVDPENEITVLSQSLAGLYPETISSINYFFFVDLDDNPATGGSPSDIGIPTSFQGAELVGQVEVNIDSGVTVSTPTIHRYLDGSFEIVNDASIQAKALRHSVVLVQELPLSPGAPTDVPVGQEIQLQFSNEIMGPMGDDIRLGVIAESPSVGLDTASAPLTFRLPAFPSARVVSPSPVPGGTVTIGAVNFLPDTVLQVYLGLVLVATGITDALGNARISFRLPENISTGDRMIAVRAPGTALTAQCSVSVKSESKPPPFQLWIPLLSIALVVIILFIAIILRRRKVKAQETQAKETESSSKKPPSR